MFSPPALDEREQQVRAEIEELAAKLRLHVHGGNRWAGALRRTIFVRNIQGSNSIEGILATVDVVGAIVAGDTPATVDEATEKALRGYQQAMTFVLQLARGDFSFLSTRR